MISIKHLNKAYGSKQILKDINLEFKPGKVYGIVGENGSGKTTLFKCLSGMENYSGEITSQFSPLKNHIGFLLTQPIFLSKTTGWEYLKLLSLARDIKEDDFNGQNIFDLPLQQYAETYSTGMKKKLALMGLLLQKNEIYILDEPFNGVDIHSNLLIQEIIKKLKESNRTVIITSHIFSTLSDSCDEIHLLKNGSISKSATKETFTDIENEMKANNISDKIKAFRI